MPIPRAQFRISTLLLLMLAVACFFGGMALQGRIDRRELTTEEFQQLMRDYWERHNPIIADFNHAIETVTHQAAKPQWTIRLGPPLNGGDLDFIVPIKLPVETKPRESGHDKRWSRDEDN